MTYLETLKRQIEECYPAAYQDYLSLQSVVPAKALITMSKETSDLKKQFEELLKTKNAEVEALRAQVQEKQAATLTDEEIKIARAIVEQVKLGNLRWMSSNTTKKSEACILIV